MPRLVRGIHPSAGAGASGAMDPGDKHRDDIEVAVSASNASAKPPQCAAQAAVGAGTSAAGARTTAAGTSAGPSTTVARTGNGALTARSDAVQEALYLSLSNALV